MFLTIRNFLFVYSIPPQKLLTQVFQENIVASVKIHLKTCRLYMTVVVLNWEYAIDFMVLCEKGNDCIERSAKTS